MRGSGVRGVMLVALLAISAPASAQPPADDVLDTVFEFNVDAQLVSTALIEVAKQADVQVAMAGSSLDEFYTLGLHGRYSLREALTKLLADTNFDFARTGANTIAVSARAAASVADAAPEPAPPPPAPPSAPSAAVSEEPPLETVPVKAPPAPPATAAAEARHAESDDVTQFEPMIVTVGKREQDVRAVAASVAALGGDALEKINAQAFEDYLKLVPGVNINRGDADKSAPIIRGVAADTLPGIGSRTTGIFVDEIPLNDLFITTANIDMNPFDLDRVEIMKGPQGTLFGSSAIAGAIRYITHKPEANVWQAKALGTYTSITDGAGKSLGAAMVNVPLGGTAAVRAVGLMRESPGYIDDLNRGLEDVGGVEQEVYRVLGRWQPLDQLDLTATWLMQDSWSPDAEFADQVERLERSNTNGPNQRQSEFAIANLVGTWDFDWARLLSSTSQVTKENFVKVNADRGLPTGGGTEQPILNAYAFGDTTGIVQELRLSSPDDAGRWQWVAGLAYLSFDSFNTSNNSGPLNPPVAGDTVSVAYTEFDAVAGERAVFAEVSRVLWDDWEVAVGGRYFKTTLVADTLIRGATQLLNGQTEARNHLTMDEAGFNPKFSVRVALTPDFSLYALAARGFQFGGVQLAPPSRVNDTIVGVEGGPQFEPYDSSTLWNYEIGPRTTWWNGRLQVDATIFHMVWKELQLAQLVYSQGRAITTVYTNVGEAHSDGVELSMQVAPQRGWRWLSSVAFIDAVTKVELETSAGSYPPGTRLPGSANFQMANTVSYEQPITFLGSWTAGASLTHSHVGRMFNDLAHSAEYGDYSTLDGGLRLTNEDLRLQPDLALTLTNLLDTRGVSGIGTCNGCPFADVYFVKPRTGTLSLTMRF